VLEILTKASVLKILTGASEKKSIKHLKTKSMENISIKVHPPWYARGTPVTNPRDGPPMAMSDKSLFAICEGPSARGKPGEVGSRKSGVGSRESEDRRPKSEDRRPKTEDRRRKSGVGSRESGAGRQKKGQTKGNNPPLADVKNHVFNTQNSVYSQWYVRNIEQVNQSHQLNSKMRRSWQPSPADCKIGW
jgi:hypothetical protein